MCKALGVTARSDSSPGSRRQLGDSLCRCMHVESMNVQAAEHLLVF